METTPTHGDPWHVVPLAVCALSAGVASFVFLADLARVTGWPGHTAYLLPLTVDALAVSAWRSWATQRGGSFALVCGVVATIASVVGNAISHVYATGRAQPGTAAVTIVAGIPAVAVALVVHMSRPTGHLDPVAVAAPTPTPAVVRGGTHRATKPTTATAPAVAPTATPAAVVPVGEAPDLSWPDTVLAAWCRDRGVTTKRPIERLGVPDRRARTVARLAKVVTA